MNRSPILAALALGAVVFGHTATAGAAPDGSPGTLGALHAAGCVPVVSLDVGANVIGYSGKGQGGCAGMVATLAYDGPAGRTVLVHLDSATVDVIPDCDAIDEQVDLWVGDVADELAVERNGGARFDSANRLITPAWLDGAPCTPPPTTIVTAPPTPPAPTFGSTVCDAATFARLDFAGQLPAEATVTLNGAPVTVSTAITPWLAVAPFDVATEVVSYTEGVTVGCWSPPAAEATATTAAPTTSTTANVVELAHAIPVLAAALPVTGPTAPWRDPMTLGVVAAMLILSGVAPVMLARRFT